MKNIILVLSLLFSVSGFGNGNHPYQNLLDAEGEDLCKMYGSLTLYNNFNKSCSIATHDLLGQGWVKSDESINETDEAERVCTDFFASKFDRNQQLCIVSSVEMNNLKKLCTLKGRYCPKELPHGKEAKICKKMHAEKDCSINFEHGLNMSLIFQTINYFLDQSNPNADTCSRGKRLISINSALIQSKIAHCNNQGRACDFYCSKERCEPYSDKEDGLFEYQKTNIGSLKKVSSCTNNISEDGVDITYKVGLKAVDKQNQIQDVDAIVSNLESKDSHLAVNNKIKINSFSSSNDEEGSASKHNGEVKSKFKFVNRKFQKNKKYTAHTFDTLNQKMADRMNKGKATKEDRKPNLVASTSNEDSLSNKKKNNKYLVASSNDSFLTQKDIFKTVSNAYYKMCQTDSCYGIVKK